MSRLETMRRFELPGIEYDREPPERGKCNECFADIPADADYGMCDECRKKTVDGFKAYLRSLSNKELELINDMCDGTDLRDIAER